MQKTIVADFLLENKDIVRKGIGTVTQDILAPYATHRVIVAPISDERVVRHTGVSLEGAMNLYVRARKLKRPDYVRFEDTTYEVNEFRDYGLEKFMLIKKMDVMK